MALPIASFDSVFRFNPAFSYAASTLRSILDNRAKMDGTLFFDRLLQMLEVKDPHLYPPRTNHHLRKLHANILAAPIADHHKISLLYYILCDCSAAAAAEHSHASFPISHLGREASVSSAFRSRASLSPAISSSTAAGLSHTFDYGDSHTNAIAGHGVPGATTAAASASRALTAGDHSPAELFASRASLPAQYIICMRGLWDLDQFFVVAGVEQLVYPSLTPLLFDHVLNFLVSYVIDNCVLTSPDPHLPATPRPTLAHLPLQYFHSSPSRPSDFATQAAYVRYLTLYIGSRAAYQHIKRFPPAGGQHQSRLLFEQIISDILSHPSLLPPSAKFSDTVTSTVNHSLAKSHHHHHRSHSHHHPNHTYHHSQYSSSLAASMSLYPIRSARATEFVSLPFTPLEQTWFDGFLSTGEGSGLPNARDALLMRRFVFGKSVADLLNIPGGPVGAAGGMGSSSSGGYVDPSSSSISSFGRNANVNTEWAGYAELAGLSGKVARADGFVRLMGGAV